jgi:ribosomal-protein-alanine N-acetyltransferase
MGTTQSLYQSSTGRENSGEQCPGTVKTRVHDQDHEPAQNTMAGMGEVFMSNGSTLTNEALKVHIRWMIRRDMPEVIQTERASFEFPWTEDDFLQSLRQRNCIGMVVELGERIVGYMIYELHKNRLHVLNFAVAAEHRRSGIGSAMIQKLMGKLTTHRRSKITLAVRERNLPAQLFFRALEFKATRVLRNYYDDSGEDAFLMELVAANETNSEPFESSDNQFAHHEER